MTLLYLTIAYLFGVALGRWLWAAQWVDCSFPTWLWLVLLAVLPLSPLCNQLRKVPGWPQPLRQPLRWPAWAGFSAPTAGPSPALLFAIGLALSLGLLRYVSHPLTPCWTPTDLAYHNLPTDRAFEQQAPQVSLTGYIASYPLIENTSQRLDVAVTAMAMGTDSTSSNPVHGRVRLTTGVNERYMYGQVVQLHGRLVTPPEFEDFSYREYLARKGIHSLLYDADVEPVAAPVAGSWLNRRLYALRAQGEALLNRLLPEPYAALANGMLLGIESGIPEALYEQFNLTGTSHVIVISGSNISIIAAVLLAIGQRLVGRRRALWPTLVGIGCYALLVGGDAAVLRAAFMGSLFVIATAIDRRSTALISLAAACWAMTLVNPLTLWDVGFQLSSAATAGLILFTPGIMATAKQLWPTLQGGVLTAQSGQLSQSAQTLVGGIIQDGLLVTIAANITTLPLVVFYFGRVSLISFLTNVLIAPVQPFIMLWGSLGILVGLLGLPWLAWMILLVPWLSLIWTVAAVQWSAALPGASIDWQGYGAEWLLLTYTCIGLLYWRRDLQKCVRRIGAWLMDEWGGRLVGSGAVAGLSVGVVLLWSVALTQPDGRLHVYFLDIGQGDGILIQTPSGRQVLIDGGANPQALMRELGAVLPFWDRTLDLLILTHPDGDHMNAQIDVPSRFKVTTALNTMFGQEHPSSERWQTAMATAGVDVQLQQQGGWIDLGDGVALWTLWPPPAAFATEDMDNENSLVMKLVYGDFSVLLTGDAGRPSEEVLLQGSSVGATVLKVGHHGSKTSTSPAFVAAVNPQLAVIQVGAENRYGHPHLETLFTLAGQLILRNDLQGRIHLWSNGHQFWMDPLPHVDW